MDWKEEQFEKFKEASSILITIFLDLGLIILVTFLLYKSTDIIEYIIGTDINDSENKTFKTVFVISKIVIIISFVIYVLQNIAVHVILNFKKIKEQL